MLEWCNRGLSATDKYIEQLNVIVQKTAKRLLFSSLMFFAITYSCYKWLSAFSIKLCYWHTESRMAWHRRILDLLSMQLIFPVGGLYGQQTSVTWRCRPSSVPQSVDGPFKLLDRGCGPFKLLDRGCGTSSLKTLQRRRHCQSSGVDWRHRPTSSYPDVLICHLCWHLQWSL